jgi:hypothetical protein
VADRLGEWLVNSGVLRRFQAGFVRNKRTTDNMFIIKTTLDKYLRAKRGCIYWCFVDLKRPLTQ